MSREGGRPVGLPTLTLIIALVAANLALAENNARVAAEIASALASTGP